MLRHFRWLGVLLLVLVLAGSAWAQSFSNFFVFGDSLSDSGNAAQAQGVPGGVSFTTNPDPVWAEIVAQTFGASGENSLAGGPNYAVAGACMNPDTPCDVDVAPTVAEQIGLHLSARGGRADADALYAVWGGLNDIIDSLVNDRVNALSHALAAADVNVAQIKRLREAGARHILVFNTPDISLAPYVVNLGQAAQGALTMLGAAYNERLYAGIRERENGIVPVNISAFFDEVVANPGTYGFTNVTGTACGEPNAMEALSVVCGPAGSGAPVTYQPSDNRRYLFADRSHPSGALHAMIASLAASMLAAPVQVSLAGEAGVDVAGVHRGAVSAERMTDFALDRPVGSWRGYVTGGIGKHELDVLPRLGETRANMQGLTLGASHRAGADLHWGAALSLARHDNDISEANIDSTVVLGSLHGTWRSGGLHLSGALSGGGTSMDIERSIRLGPARRFERGSTSAVQFGAEIELGWLFGEPAALQHGPFLGFVWIDQEVKGYRESGRILHLAELLRLRARFPHRARRLPAHLALRRRGPPLRPRHL